MKISFYCLTIYGEITNKNKIKNNNMINEHTSVFSYISKANKHQGPGFC